MSRTPSGTRQERTMSHCAEFQIIGRIGQIKKVGTTLRVTIASGYPYKDDHGEWKERTRWNHRLQRHPPVLRPAESQVRRPHPRHRRPRADELGEERRNPLRRHPCLRADRTPRQGPGPHRRRRRQPLLTNARGGESLPARHVAGGDASRPAPPTNPSPLWRLICSNPQTEGPHAGGARLSKTASEPKAAYRLSPIRWLY
jgi:hypothetical protein